jgi:xanthine dehydrogenase accessory factor
LDESVYLKIGELLKDQKQAAVATIISATPGTPRKIGTKMLVMPDGSITGTIGGGKLEKDVMDRAIEVCNRGEPLLINEDLSINPGGIGAVCGGQISIFIEPILKKPGLFIFGAGHVGKAIAQMAQFLDFSIHVIDDRPEWANTENYPMDCRLWTGEVFQSAQEIPADANSFIVILTRSWKMDEGILKRVIRKDYKYLGIIGSKSKVKTHYENLQKEGFAPADFTRVYTPIGLPIGAYSPQEIAVSILAEIIAVQKGTRDSLAGWEGALDLRNP